MFTFKEKKDYFISECKSKRYLMKRLIELHEKMENLSFELQSNIANPKALMCEEELLIAEERVLTDRLNNIDDMIAAVRDPLVRGMITALWIDHHSKTRVSQDFDYCEQQIYKKIEKELHELLK